jgi:hypothetical protein
VGKAFSELCGGKDIFLILVFNLFLWCWGWNPRPPTFLASVLTLSHGFSDKIFFGELVILEFLTQGLVLAR